VRGLAILPWRWRPSAVLEQIPLAAIGAMLLLVAWSLFDVARLRQISRLSRIEFGIAIATLLATLLLRLEVAVLLGTALSLAPICTRHPDRPSAICSRTLRAGATFPADR
jgi:MFS superfamily sulfate permease-like transporter